MRKISLVWVLPVLALLGACDMFGTGGGFTPEPEAVVIPEDFLGVVHGGEATGAADIEYEFVKYLGAKWILQTFYWSDFEKNDMGGFEADPTRGGKKYADWVNWANQNGLKMFAVLAYSTDWMKTTYAGGKADYIPPAQYDRYCAYVTEIIKRYGDKLAGYSIWNEPNENPRFWTGTPAEMWDLTRTAAAAARQAIHQYNPGGQLVGGALNILAPDLWTRGFFVSGAMANTDGFAYHPYMPNAKNAAAITREVQHMVSRYGFADRVWLTEMGFPTGGQYSTVVEEDRMPAEVVKTIVLMASRGVKHLFWYQLFDDLDNVDTPNPDNSEDWFGLAYYKPSSPNLLNIPANATGITKKKGADAYALCGKYIQGTTWRRLPLVSGPEDVEAYYFEGKNGARTLVLWADRIDAAATAPARVTLPGSDQKRYSLGDSGPFTTGDDAASLGQPVPESGVYPVGSVPLFFTWTAESGLPRVTAP